MFVCACVYLTSKALFPKIKVVKSPQDLFSTMKAAASENYAWHFEHKKSSESFWGKDVGGPSQGRPGCGLSQGALHPGRLQPTPLTASYQLPIPQEMQMICLEHGQTNDEVGGRVGITAMM